MMQTKQSVSKRHRPRESTLETYFVHKLTAHGYYVVKGENISGFPDRIVIKDGIVSFVELKRDYLSKPRPLQKAVMADLAAHGANVYLVQSKDDIDAFLDNTLKPYDENIDWSFFNGNPSIHSTQTISASNARLHHTYAKVRSLG